MTAGLQLMTRTSKVDFTELHFHEVRCCRQHARQNIKIPLGKSLERHCGGVSRDTACPTRLVSPQCLSLCGWRAAGAVGVRFGAVLRKNGSGSSTLGFGEPDAPSPRASTRRGLGTNATQRGSSHTHSRAGAGWVTRRQNRLRRHFSTPPPPENLLPRVLF